jgi:hypothetical protein
MLLRLHCGVGPARLHARERRSTVHVPCVDPAACCTVGATPDGAGALAHSSALHARKHFDQRVLGRLALIACYVHI